MLYDVFIGLIQHFMKSVCDSTTYFDCVCICAVLILLWTVNFLMADSSACKNFVFYEMCTWKLMLTLSTKGL